MGLKQFFIDNFDLQSVVNSFLGGFVVHILNCIKNFIFSPKIRISIDLNDENLFKTIPSGIDILHSLKLQVRNDGRKTANNVQIIVDKVNNNDNISENLIFSYQDYAIENKHPIFVSKNIGAKTNIHCDFLYIICDSNSKSIKETKLATEVQQHRFFNQSENYEILISVSGDNIQTKKYKITFSYDCNSIEKRLIISKFNINKEIF